MKAPPKNLTDDRVVSALRTGWSFVVNELRYLPLGFGSHHWLVTRDDGEKFFVSVDETSGDDHENVASRAALTTARRLKDHGLAFVAAPLPGVDGTLVRPMTSHYSVAVYPHLAGVSGEFAEAMDFATLQGLVAILGELHASTSVVRETVAVDELKIEAAHAFELVWATLDGHGALQLPPGVTAQFAPRRSFIDDALERFSEFARSASEQSASWVVTHGEPHLGNVLRHSGRLLLVDWETARLSMRERDLWLVVKRNPDAESAYRQQTGYTLDRSAMQMFELRWWLSDLALFVEDLADETRSDEDRAASLRFLETSLQFPPAS